MALPTMFLVWLDPATRPCLLPGRTREPLSICRTSPAREVSAGNQGLQGGHGGRRAAARTAATTRATAAGSGVPSASVNSRCAAPIRVGASVLITASAATRARSGSAAGEPGDRGGGRGAEGEAGAGGGPQPGAQFVARDDQADERENRRGEQVRERSGQVARDGAAPRHGAQGRRRAADPCDAVERELGEERVELGEVPVQHSFGYARFRGDRAAGQAAGAVPEQDALGGVEEPPSRVAA